MSLARYSILVIAIALGTLGLVLPLASLDGRGRTAVVLGAIIAVLNTIAAHALARWAASRSFVAFLRAVLGGMVGRMAFMLVALLLGVKALELPQLPLAVALLAYFVVFLTIELAIVQRPSPAGALR